MKAKEYLTQLIIMDENINRKHQRLETLRGVAFNTSSNYSSEAVQRTREKNPLENIMAKIVDLSREIDNDIDALVDFKAEVWEMLDKIDDEKQKRILWFHYAERKSWTQIAEELIISRRHCIRLHIRALDSFEKIFSKK